MCKTKKKKRETDRCIVREREKERERETEREREGGGGGKTDRQRDRKMSIIHGCMFPVLDKFKFLAVLFFIIVKSRHIIMTPIQLRI